MEPRDHYEFDETFLPQSALLEAVKGLPTPCYLFDARGIRRNVRTLSEAFGGNPGFRPCVPVRLAPYEGVLRRLREEGCGVSCSTLEELRLAFQCGFSADAVSYAPLCPTAEELGEAVARGVQITVDNPAFMSVFVQCGALPRRVALRCNPGGKFLVDGRAVARPGRSKLGMPLGQILELAPVLQRNGVETIGLSVELNCQTCEAGYYAAVANCLLEAAELLRRQGVTTEFLDLGDGLAIALLPGDPVPDLTAMGRRLQGVLERYGAVDCPVSVGPGRWILGPCGILVTKVLGVKELERNFLLVDADASQFVGLLRGARHHISLLGKTKRSGRVAYDVVGGLPDLTSRFAERHLLPPANAGDYCVIHGAGFAASAQILRNGVSPCGVYLYDEEGRVEALG